MSTPTDEQVAETTAIHQTIERRAVRDYNVNGSARNAYAVHQQTQLCLCLADDARLRAFERIYNESSVRCVNEADGGRVHAALCEHVARLCDAALALDAARGKAGE